MIEKWIESMVWVGSGFHYTTHSARECPKCEQIHTYMGPPPDECKSCGWRPTDRLTELEDELNLTLIERLSGRMPVKGDVSLVIEAVLLLIKAEKERAG